MNVKKTGNKLVSIIMIIIGGSFVFPLFWMLGLSFKSKSEVYDNPFGLPREWIFNNYPDVLSGYKFFSYILNSAIYTVGAIVLTIILGSMLAYSLSRMNWKHGKYALNYISLGLIIPVQVVIIPLYMLVRQIGIKNTYLGLIIPYAAFAISSCVLMLYAFFRTLPKELEEAAYLDGCNVYQSFWKIILPTVKPAIATQCVLLFMNTWNEFFLAFIIAGKDSLRPLTVGLLNYFVSIGSTHWGQIGAAMIISSLPTIIIYLIGNEQIENALTAGAILK